MTKEQFVSLLKEHERSLRLLSRSLTGNWADADDALQEAVLSAFVARNQLRKSAAFRAWLRRILVHECMRARQKRLQPVDPVDLQNKFAVMDDHSELSFLSLVDHLPVELAQVVSLRYLADMSQAETAEVLGIPLGTVKSRLNRAISLLRSQLSGGEYGVLPFCKQQSASLSL